MSSFLWAKYKIGKALLVVGVLFLSPVWGYSQEGALVKGLFRITRSTGALEENLLRGGVREVQQLSQPQITRAVEKAAKTAVAQNINVSDLTSPHTGPMFPLDRVSPPVRNELPKISHPVPSSVSSVNKPLSPQQQKEQAASWLAERAGRERGDLLLKYGDASLLHAAQEGLINSVRFMVEQQGAAVTDEVIFAARDSESIELLRYVVRIKGATRSTLQATWNYPDLLEELLARPALIDGQYFSPGEASLRPSTKDQWGTLLYFAAGYAHSKSVALLCDFFNPPADLADIMLQQAFLSHAEDRLSVGERLITHFGADPTPAISYIVSQAKYDWIAPLKELGADVNFKNKYGEAPLHVAVNRIPYQRNRAAYIKTVEELINNGADVTLENAEHQTAGQILQERLEEMDGKTTFPAEFATALKQTRDLLEKAVS